MNIGFMRKTDYWVGIPLTTLASLWLKLRSIFSPRQPLDRAIQKAKRVLFIELSEMGSAILADPALKRMSQAHEIYFIIFKKNAASLGIFGSVLPDHIFLLRDDSFFTLTGDTIRFFFWCRKNKIDAVVDLELFSRFTALLSAFSGATVRVGFFNPRSEGLYRGHILTHPISYNPHQHIAKNFIALTEVFFDPYLAKGTDPLVRRQIQESEISLVHVSPPLDAVERVRNQLRKRIPVLQDSTKIVLVNINAGDFLPQRKWAKDSFTALIEMVLKLHSDSYVVLTGSPKERASVEEVCSRVAHKRCVNIAGDLAFEDLPALYSQAQCLLTNDSGPAHFASAVGLKTFVLFGPETPSLYGPLRNAVPIWLALSCSPCVYATNHRDTPCTDNQCLKQISPQFVYQQMQGSLA